MVLCRSALVVNEFNYQRAFRSPSAAGAVLAVVAELAAVVSELETVVSI